MTTKAQLINGINLACAHLMRSTGPGLRPNSTTGAIEEDSAVAVVGQSVGDAPIVCIVPPEGSAINRGTPVSDKMGVVYNPVRLPSGMSGYRYFQPNNDYYAQITDSELTHDNGVSLKTTIGRVRVKFIDKNPDSQIVMTPPIGSPMPNLPVTVSSPLEIMELEVRKITRWGAALIAPEFEYQARVVSRGADFPHARAVFLPDRLIESNSWTTVWKSSSSVEASGPTFHQRAAAVPGLSPFTMLMARQGAMISSIPGLATRANGIRNFYERNNVTFELFEGLGGNFHIFGDDPHFIHSDQMFAPGEKTQTEPPRFDWWWWPTRTGTPLTRDLYTTLHFPWKEGARSIEALFYLFRYADQIPPMTASQEDGIRHCYEWLRESRFDGDGLPREFLEGLLGSVNQWGDHLPWRELESGLPIPIAFPVPNISQHPPAHVGWHRIYWGDHLLRFAIACGWLYRALEWQRDTTKANEVRTWLLESVDVLLALQVPWNGIFVDDEGIEYCQVDVAGGLFSAYRMVDGDPRSCRYPNALEGVATAIGAALPNAQLQQGLVPSPHAAHYELSIGVILAFSLAYNIVDE